MRVASIWWLSIGAAAAGGLQALAVADPWTGQPHGWLQVVSLAVLVALLQPLAQNARSRRGLLQAAVLGWLFALAWLGGTFWWLFVSMHTYGGLAAPLAAAAVFLLAAFLALGYGAACALWLALAARLPTSALVWRALLFAALWTLVELVRGRWLSGFPWGAGGYAHVSGWFAGFASWGGVYGIGFLAALFAALLASLLALHVDSIRRAHAVLALVGVVAAGVLAPMLLAQQDEPVGPPMDVALLQGNIPQDEKFVPGTGVADALQWYGAQLLVSEATLTVVPETAIPLLPSQLPDDYLQQLQDHFDHAGKAALLGIPLGSFERGYTNSVIAVGPESALPYRYDKHHLVPFGEFIPPLFRWFTDLMHIPLGDFNRGPLQQPSFRWQGQALAPNICYEDLFGEELAVRFADAARAPTVLVNMSNIGWFGNTVAVDQHLQISRMRALEFARPVLRATNTGATAIIDHRGEVTGRLPRFTQGVLHGTFEGRRQITPYAFWASRFGLLPLWLGCLLLLGGGMAVISLNRRTHGAG